MNKLMTTLAISAALLSGQAIAGDKCDVPTSEWQTEEAFREAVAQKGWEIKKFKIDDGCYEIYGWDEKKRRIEAYFNPKTFEIVKMELED